VTDFLSSLSERAVGQAPVLERRRPALFEPVVGSVPLDETRDVVALRETTAEVVARKPASVQQSPGLGAPLAEANAIDRLPSSQAINTTRAENSPAEPNAVLESNSKRRADDSSATLIVERRVEAAPREESRPSSRDRRTPIGPPEMNSPLRVVETRIEKEAVSALANEKDSRFEPKDKGNEPSLRQQPSTVTPVVRHPRNKPDVETRIETRVENNNEPLLPRHDLKSPPIMRLPQPAVPRVASRRLAAPKLNAPPVPPTIQVTIGRVEVRATAATPAKPARPSAKPTLSLEDYLRGRSGESK
jgi:hypothetical protein